MTAIVAGSFVVVAAGGAVARWRAASLNRHGMPVGTLLVNICASLLAGVVGALTSQTAEVIASATVRDAVVTVAVGGFAGALSTFSTFAEELAGLVRERRMTAAVGYGMLTAVGSVGAATVGLSIPL